MAQFTDTEIKSLDLIGPFGPFGNISGNSTFTQEGLDLIGPFGPFWSITVAGGSEPPVTYDATRMFMLF